MNSPFTTGQRYVGSLGNQHDDGKQDILLKIYRLTNVREIHIQPMLSVCLMKIKHNKSQKKAAANSLNKSQEFHQVKNLSL